MESIPKRNEKCWALIIQSKQGFDSIIDEWLAGKAAEQKMQTSRRLISIGVLRLETLYLLKIIIEKMLIDVARLKMLRTLKFKTVPRGSNF